MNADAAQAKFRELGCDVSAQWLHQQPQHQAEQQWYAALLAADFHEQGVLERGSLERPGTPVLLHTDSEDGSSLPSTARLAGPCVVQVDLVLDIGAPRGPARIVVGGPDTASPAKGALKLVCFDGHRAALAVEKRPLFGRENGGVPRVGAKIILRNVRVRRGTLVLEEGTVAVLGGCVPERERAVLRMREEEEARTGRRKTVAPQQPPAPALPPPKPPAPQPGGDASRVLVVGAAARQEAQSFAPVVVKQPQRPAIVAQPQEQHKPREADDEGRQRQQHEQADAHESEPQSLIDAIATELTQQEQDQENNQDVEEEGDDDELDGIGLDIIDELSTHKRIDVMISSPVDDFRTLKEAMNMLGTEESGTKDTGVLCARCVVKAALTSVLSPLRCDGVNFALDVRMEDGMSAAKATLASSVCEAMLGMTPEHYSSLLDGSPQEQEARKRLQEEITQHEGLYTLERLYDPSTSQMAVMVTHTEPVNATYFVYLIRRVGKRAAPTHPAVAALVDKIK